MKQTRYAIAASLLCAGSVYAHSGHGTISATQMLHYGLEPAHSLPALVLLAAAVGVLRFRRKRARAASRRSTP